MMVIRTCHQPSELLVFKGSIASLTNSEKEEFKCEFTIRSSVFFFPLDDRS